MILMHKRATIAAFALCALGGSLSSLSAAGPGESGAEAAAVPVYNGTELPRFQPSVEAFAASSISDEIALVEEAVFERVGGGEASWYGKQFAGRRTASGERFDPAELTAAHRTLPFGTKVRVTNARNGDSVVVRINDRGPYAHNRVIDLSHAAAREIGIVGAGRGEVELALLVS